MNDYYNSENIPVRLTSIISESARTSGTSENRLKAAVVQVLNEYVEKGVMKERARIIVEINKTSELKKQHTGKSLGEAVREKREKPPTAAEQKVIDESLERLHAADSNPLMSGILMQMDNEPERSVYRTVNGGGR